MCLRDVTLPPMGRMYAICSYGPSSFFAQLCTLHNMTKRVEESRQAGAHDERERALWSLARHLFEEIERLDPSSEETWDELPDSGRKIWYFAIKAVLLEHADVNRVLEIDQADCRMIGGGPNLRK
jgi:hypothetical protein